MTEDYQSSAQAIAVDYLWQRDECRAKCHKLARENERLKIILRYAEEAIEEEFTLRLESCKP